MCQMPSKPPQPIPMLAIARVCLISEPRRSSFVGLHQLTLCLQTRASQRVQRPMAEVATRPLLDHHPSRGSDDVAAALHCSQGHAIPGTQHWKGISGLAEHGVRCRPLGGGELSPLSSVGRSQFDGWVGYCRCIPGCEAFQIKTVL